MHKNKSMRQTKIIAILIHLKHIFYLKTNCLHCAVNITVLNEKKKYHNVFHIKFEDFTIYHHKDKKYFHC